MLILIGSDSILENTVTPSCALTNKSKSNRLYYKGTIAGYILKQPAPSSPTFLNLTLRLKFLPQKYALFF